MSRSRRLAGLAAGAALAAAALAPAALGRAAGEPAADGVIAIVGGTVHTLGPAGTIEGATVLIVGGRIEAVGVGVAVPAGAERIDARGRIVTPGLFDSLNGIGAVEISAEGSTRDTATELPRLGAAFSVASAINPRSTLIPINRVEGLTRALVAPSATTGPIAGRAATIHLGGGDDPVLDPAAALVVALGQEGASLAGGSRAAALALVAEALDDARDYAGHREEFEHASRRPYAPSRLDLEALQPVLAGEMPLAVHAERASDVLAALRLASEQRVRLVVAGGAEAWLVAPALAEAGVPVVLDPLSNLPSSFEVLAATLENAARLHAAGVTVAFSSGASHNARNLRQAAGNAVAHGLPWEAGLAAITRVPAELWGLGASCGTLEPGRDADLVIWDGDPLEVTSFPERVFIRGREVPQVNRQRLLRDRYLDLDTPLPPAYVRP